MRSEIQEHSKAGKHDVDFPLESVWGTYHTIAQRIVPILKAFRSLDKHGCPPDFDSVESWDMAIDKMICAFELVEHTTLPDTEQDSKAFHEGLELFCRYYLDLWD